MRSPIDFRKWKEKRKRKKEKGYSGLFMPFSSGGTEQGMYMESPTIHMISLEERLGVTLSLKLPNSPGICSVTLLSNGICKSVLTFCNEPRSTSSSGWQ